MKTWFPIACLLCAPIHAATVDEALKLDKQWAGRVFRTDVEATWTGENSFWYRIAIPGRNEYVQVDAATGARKVYLYRQGLGLPARDQIKTSESRDVFHPSTNGAPSSITFLNHLKEPVQMVWVDTKGKRVDYKVVAAGGDFQQRTTSGHVWMVKDLSGKALAYVTARAEPLEVEIDGPSPFVKTGAPSSARPSHMRSPNGRWSAYPDQGKLMLTDRRTGKSTEVKTGLDAGQPAYAGITWAPDSSCFVAFRAVIPPLRKITLIESSPENQVQPSRRDVDYTKPGDPLPKPVPVLVHPTQDGQEVQVVKTDLFANPFIQKGSFETRWAADSSEFYFDYNQRGHQCYRVIGVNAVTAEVRAVIEETSKTFIDYIKKTWRQWLDKTGEVLWMSERDGWCHLWLYDLKTGQVKKQVTQGQWVVREVESVDEDKRQVWFMASGLRPGEDPYHQHLCRVNLNGTGFIQLTEGDGDHRITWSPGRTCFIDIWSRADHPPVAELRRGTDGSLVTTLETADAAKLLATGWQMPERFTAKGRDGKTEIHGTIVKPSFFDPQKKYPVVEQVYAGPHSAFAAKTFGTMVREHQLAELGFIVVQSDGMGTNHRGKAFHDVCWKNLKDAGFPDRIAWIKAAAATRPWMDVERVGIYGGSAGGQNAMRALLDHHDFYSVAIADCGCHDNRMDKIWWNEQWMGWPVDESYKLSSNVEDAARLQGHLLLTVGELDDNVDPSTTYQVINALQKAGKPFEFMPITGKGHGAGETPFAARLRMDFLIRHLQ